MAIKSLLSTEIKSLLNKSIESELYANHLYLHIANQLQRLGFFGSQEFYLRESAEELTHYQKIVNYMNDMGTVAEVAQVPKMIDKITSLMDALETSYETELELLKQYQKFYEQAEDDLEDCTTAIFLQEFIIIQTKAVGLYGDLITRLNKSPTDVFMFDKYLSKQ